MIPPDAIITAAARWLRLLRSSTLAQASEIIRAGSDFADLTQTQYASGLEWLRNSELLVRNPHKLELSSPASKLPEEQLSHLFFQIILEKAAPAWLADADVLIPEPGELPQDAYKLAQTLGIDEQEAFAAIKQLHGKIDFAERARIGDAGEHALVSLLESQWPGSTTHISITDDGFGYDVVFNLDGIHWHLEVKSTMRRGRLVTYLSRHEHEVGRIDPRWRLVVVGLDNQMKIQAIATVRHTEVLARAPRDLCSESKWQSALHELKSRDLQRGLAFLTGSKSDLRPSVDQISVVAAKGCYEFSWMPREDIMS